MKVKIAHLSDPHFGTVKYEIQEALLSKIKEISPSLIVISGDISQRARYKQFRQALEFNKQLKEFPIIAIPGNHDIPLFNIFARLFYPYAGFRSVFKGILNRQIMVHQVQVLALNSTSRFRHIQGDLNLKKLEKHLSEMSPDAIFKIVTFHHPMACPKRVDVKNLLIGRNEVIKILEKYQVDLILGGHIHDPYVCLSSEHYQNIDRPTVISVAGTCLSWRTRADAPNSFHLIEIDTEAPTEPLLNVIRYDIQSNFIFEPIDSNQFRKTKDCGWKRF